MRDVIFFLPFSLSLSHTHKRTHTHTHTHTLFEPAFTLTFSTQNLSLSLSLSLSLRTLAFTLTFSTQNLSLCVFSLSHRSTRQLSFSFLYKSASNFGSKFRKLKFSFKTFFIVQSYHQKVAALS